MRRGQKLPTIDEYESFGSRTWWAEEISASARDLYDEDRDPIAERDSRSEYKRRRTE